MLSRKQLYQTPEYWMEKVQNDLFRALVEFQEKHKLNQTELAAHLGFSKGYISQVLNGNFNFSLKKLIELSLAVGVAPSIEFNSIKDYMDQEERKLELMQNTGFVKVENLSLSAHVSLNDMISWESNKSA